MLLAQEQSETIEKANLLIVNSCTKGFYGSVVIKIEDGIIERIVRENGAKKPFNMEVFGINIKES